MPDRYGTDVLASDPHPKKRVREVPAEPGMVVECAVSGWCGAVVGLDKGTTGWAVVLEDRHGRRRPFALAPAGFLLEGEPVTLVRPQTGHDSAPARTRSGSVAAPASQRARVARGARIWVEGTQDAELVERVWGADLRDVGVVVEPIGGVDELLSRLAEFGPDQTHRVGVLVDHLVSGSKESRLADEAGRRYPRSVRVVGHPYIDVWQAVRPVVVGIEAWPNVPKGEDWKTGVCARLGWESDTARVWKRILGRVSSYTDLETSLIARVEELIDFVTGP